MSHPNKKDTRILENLTGCWVKWASSQWALEVVLSFLALWLFVGPFMKFSANWQMIMSTSSSAITLVMVFLLVRTQTKDTLVIQMKLNEVIAALQGANNQLISIENLSETAVLELSKRYEAVATKLLNDDAVSTESIISHEIVAEEEKHEAEII
jgi:low affinity Fe/Cu permease